ncbi:putative bifunctional diguanylate cyclase/phosphodiesterase [Paractinoplanes deccanensis]|nr:bifunctional diguanylate cyclase/phosphodiesterase [Actinoplanes deccanensis]
MGVVSTAPALAARRSALARLRGLVDALLIVTSLVVLCWNLVVQPAQAADPLVSLARPVADVLLASVALIALGRCRRGSSAVGVLALTSAGALLVASADAIAYQRGADGPGWIPLGAALLIVLAGAYGARGPAGVPAGRLDIELLLPYGVVVLTLLAGLFWISSGGAPTAFGTWCRFLTILLIVAREGILLADNRRLARGLEDRVAARTAERQVREQRFRALVEQSSDSLAILEADSTVRFQSSSIERIFGYRAADLTGMRLIDTAGHRAGVVIAAKIGEVLGTAGATTTFEVTLRHADGVHRLAEMTITNLLGDPYVRGLVSNTRDISEATDLQDQLRHEAYHDALTGLANRALFREHLAAAMARGDVAILFLDLDGFKEINDSLGHAAGDALLVQVADRLRAAGPDLVARLGGDEFALITSTASAAGTAARILAELAVPFTVDGRGLHAGAGIGIATSADATDIEQLQRNADLAMYKSKDAGGGIVTAYHPSMHDALVQRVSLAGDLRAALLADQLVLHYQPTADLRTGEIVGFEALVRWHHPTRGMVSPADFIGLAESTGLIVPLGRWVLTEACRQAVAWGGAYKMAVNVSVRQFEAGDLAATVAAVLAETGMPPGKLVLEMTESVLLTDTDENLERIVALKSLGVLLAMDDFGTGYSSLAYLRRFPMDVLKIDRSFVERLGGDPSDVALVRTIIRLGARFGMRTVAEGIEDAEQLAILRDMGCDFGQGYFLSRPVAAADVTEMLVGSFRLAS